MLAPRANTFDRLRETFEQAGADFSVLEHAPEGRCEAVSALRGNPPERAVKALVVRAKRRKRDEDRDYYLLALPGTLQADFGGLQGYEDVRLVTPAELLDLTGCQPGTVPPVSFDPRVRVVMDPACLAEPELWFNAGRLDRSMRIATSDYRRIVDPLVLLIAHGALE